MEDEVNTGSMAVYGRSRTPDGDSDGYSKTQEVEEKTKKARRSELEVVESIVRQFDYNERVVAVEQDDASAAASVSWLVEGDAGGYMLDLFTFKLLSIINKDYIYYYYLPVGTAYSKLNHLSAYTHSPVTLLASNSWPLSNLFRFY